MRGLAGTLAAGLGFKAQNETTFGTIEEIWRDLFARPSKSGVAVTWQNALKVTTALACCRRIAEGTSTVPCKLYRRPPGSQHRAEAREHPLYPIVADKPSDLQNSLEFRETMTFHCVLAGNAYALKNRVNGRIAELIPMTPERTSVRQLRDLSLVYTFTTADGQRIEIPAGDVWHLRGPSWNSWAGLDAVQLLREALGLAIATEESQAKLHASGGKPAGILSFKGELDQAARDRIKAAWAELREGNAAVLDNEAKWHALAMSGVDNQHVETRRVQVEEICRGLGVMPIMVGLADKVATYASAEQMFLAHLTHTVRPWHRRFEYSMNLALLSEEERREGYYFGFVDQEFMRATARDRAEYNKIALGGGANPGWRTLNQVRGDDDEPPLPGGDHLYAPANAGPIGPDGIPQTATGAKPAPSPPSPPNDE